MLFATPSA
eukprot:gene466-246_t